MVGIFRNLRMRNNDNDFMPQMVREYHKRFVEIKEKYNVKNDIHWMRYRIVISLYGCSFKANCRCIPGEGFKL